MNKQRCEISGVEWDSKPRIKKAKDIILEDGLALINDLLEDDPEIDSPEGIFLKSMGVALAKYEQEIFD
jgi:hypothetical protein